MIEIGEWKNTEACNDGNILYQNSDMEQLHLAL